MELGLSQVAVAERLQVNEGTVVNWEKGHREPKARYIPKIIEFLGYSPPPEEGTLGERLRTYRLEQGLSQRELAVRIGVDPESLGKWERDERDPRNSSRVQVERLLSDLMDEEEERET